MKPRRTGRRRRLRVLAGLCAAAASVTALVLLYLYVSVVAGFDGRLWQIPSRIYSDVSWLAPGERLGATALVERLERSGYARSADAPRRAGQFVRRGETVDLFLRGFVTPVVRQDPRRVRVTFRGDRVAAVSDARGRGVRRVALEPEILATLYGPRQEERELIRLEAVPEGFVRAVLAAEDARFFAHHGVDVRGTVRAAWVNVREGRIVQGGSTITQQTVKNLLLDPRRTWWRKLREAAMAVLLDLRYPKQRILEVYLNEVYLGQSGPVAICGVQAAARHYFGLPLSELSLGEWATVAGLIRSPGTYNPFVHPERARERRDDVLEAMVRLGFLGADEARRARGEPLRLASGGRGFTRAPFAVEYIRAQVGEIHAAELLSAEGWEIHTTLDTRAQASAEAALTRGIERLEREQPSVRRQLRERRLEGAVIVTRPSSGAILALVGGRDYRRSQFNRAVQARRQPGSCFKPLVYAAGFEQGLRGRVDGLTAATLLDDSPIDLVSGGRRWSPENYDRLFRGPVTARQALEESLNVPTVRAAQLVGLKPIVETARACGVRSPLAEVPSIALGTAEVTPLELAAVYGTFAHRGLRTTPWIVRAVLDRDGRALAGEPTETARAIGEETAFLTTDLLYGVLERGTASSAATLGFGVGAAGKTGTTDDTRDAWFVGFTRDTLGLVWVGYDDNARTGLTGATGALPIWVDLMSHAPGGDEPLVLDVPARIVLADVDRESGELAVAGCHDVLREFFVDGTQPSRSCSLHAGRFRRWLRRFLGREPGPPGV